MVTGSDFIVFSDDWGRHPFSCQHLMKQFLPDNRAIWVHTVGMRRPRLTWYDLRRSIQKVRSFAASPPPESLPHNLTILSPPMLPFGNRFVRLFNRSSVIRAVRRTMEERNFQNPIFLTTLPNAAEYLGAFGEKTAVYYCVDDFILWPGVNRRLVREMEERLLRGVDLLVCSSGELASLKSRPGLRTEILPHGVDIEHFGRSADACIPLRRLEEVRKPILVYFGLLGEWVDVALLEELATRHPEWSLVLIGNVVVDITSLAALPNVVFIGAVPYQELPEYVAFADVLLLPYIVTGRGHSITPLKLREYIATGKPVVTTAIPECYLYRSVITVAESREAFFTGVSDAVKEGGERAEERRRAVVKDSWRQRAETFSSFLAGLPRRV